MAIVPATLNSKKNDDEAVAVGAAAAPSSQLKTVLRYFELIKTLDTVELGKLFADDFVQSTRPLSLGVPSRTKEEDLAFLRGLAEKIEGRRLEVSQSRFASPPPPRTHARTYVHIRALGGRSTVSSWPWQPERQPKLLKLV